MAEFDFDWVVVGSGFGGPEWLSESVVFGSTPLSTVDETPCWSTVRARCSYWLLAHTRPPSTLSWNRPGWPGTRIGSRATLRWARSTGHRPGNE
jgi:hypothetical protein